MTETVTNIKGNDKGNTYFSYIKSFNVAFCYSCYSCAPFEDSFCSHIWRNSWLDLGKNTNSWKSISEDLWLIFMDLTRIIWKLARNEPEIAVKQDYLNSTHWLFDSSKNASNCKEMTLETGKKLIWNFSKIRLLKVHSLTVVRLYRRMLPTGKKWPWNCRFCYRGELPPVMQPQLQI